MSIEYVVKGYFRSLSEESLKRFLRSCKHSKTMTSYDADVTPFSEEKFTELVLSGPGGYFGVILDPNTEEGYTFSVTRKNEGYVVEMDYLLNEGFNKDLFIEHVEKAYKLLNPYFIAADDSEHPRNPRPAGNRLPNYFEWFWILGPKLAKQYDLSKIPPVFKVKRFEGGGVMILDPDPLNSKVTEQDKKKLYKLPKKKE